MKKWLPIFVSVLIITMNVLSADAAENILRGVNVRASENAYTIELTSTAPARMTKNIVSLLVTYDATDSRIGVVQG